MNIKERVHHKVMNYKSNHAENPKYLYMHPALKSQLCAEVEPWMVYSTPLGHEDIYLGLKIIEVYTWDYLEVH